MAKSVIEKEVLGDYAFSFDALPQRVAFTKQIKITGWLLHRRGLPIHGIRGVVRRVLRRKAIFRARRKRSRPSVAAAYPDLAEAGQSGFLLLLELAAGPNPIEIQVQDHHKIWRTIFVASIWAFPLRLIGRIGLPRVEQFLVWYVAQLFLEDKRSAATSLKRRSIPQIDGRFGRASVQEFLTEAGSTPCEIRAVQLFVTSKSNLFIREIAELLCAGFRAAGCEAQLLVDQIPAEKTEEGKIQIVVTPHEFFNLFLRYKLSWEHIQRLTNHLLLLSTEQPESEWFDSNLVTAPHARAMLDIHLSGVVAYRARGLRCFHLPLGYDPLLEQKASLTHPPRDVDVCLLAAMTDRREKFIAANADFFAAHDCHLRFVPIAFAKTEETQIYLPSPERTALLQRTKILLNVHYSELPYFEWHRALITLTNCCCLITEKSQGFEPLVPGRHFVMAKADDLTTCCEYYLKHEDERQAIAQAAYQFIRERFTQKQNCREFLQRITKELGRQDIQTERTFDLRPKHAELAIEPLPEPLAKDLSRRPISLLFSALREDLSNMFRSSATTPEVNGEIPMNASDTTQRVTILSEMRRGYIERSEAQKRILEQRKPIFTVDDNPRLVSSAPAVSVIVTLYNYRTYIRECLKSVENARTAAIPGGVEVVIVNDASTDDSLKQAVMFQRNSCHPVRIVDKQLNTGLADARNIGLQLARAPYAFILDADNMIFPRALEQLYMKAVAEGSAAVYSMLCRFQTVKKNREGLLSYFDWDPQMLVEHPYVDAMALFHRDRLMELGGYDTELYKFGWFGWEDYDLWLRMAQAKIRVSFVPNVLCLYRHHQSSMSNATNVFECELVAHLFTKYRSLLETYPPKRRILGLNRSRFEESAATRANTCDPAAVQFEAVEVISRR